MDVMRRTMQIAARCSCAAAFVVFWGPCEKTTSSGGASAVSSAASGPDVDVMAGVFDAGPHGRVTLMEPRSALGIADANDDGVDDVIVVARAVNGDDDHRRLVAVDGKTHAVLWRTDPIRPWGAMPAGARIMILTGGGNVALATGWTTVAIHELKSGREKETLVLDGVPSRRTCVDPSNPARHYTTLTEGTLLRSHEIGGAWIDVAAAKSERAPRPPFCRPWWISKDPDLEACNFSHHFDRSRAACSGPARAPKTSDRFEAVVVLTTPEASVAVGNGPRIVFPNGASDEGLPELVRFDPSNQQVMWTRIFEDASYEKKTGWKDDHRITKVDVTPAGIVVVLGIVEGVKEHGQRLFMLDPANGKTIWERTLGGSTIDAPRVVGGRLYLPRKRPYDPNHHEEAPPAFVDVLEASTGRSLFSIAAAGSE